MSIAVIITDRNSDKLCHLLKKLLPTVNIQQWPDITHPQDIKLAVLWKHPPGITETYLNLQMVVSMGAGMDHIDCDKRIPKSVKRKRIVTLALQQNMAQYVLQHILEHHRNKRTYQLQQKQKYWHVLETDQAIPTIGFLGLGQLGAFVADRCTDLGFTTMAWTASQLNPKHRCFHGKKGLRQVCQNSDFLIVLLPLNDHTKNIINAETLSWCKNNAVLINVGRGAHVNEAELLSALNSNHIKHAILDVFQQEPLAPEHAFWLHPKISLTPHSSSRSDVQQTAEHVIKYYQQLSVS